MSPIISLKALSFAWPGQPELLHIPSLELNRGEHLFIQGPSGSGKSTLLNLITGFLSGFSGQILIADQPLDALSRRQIDRLRADHLGILFQQFNLLPYLDLIENVCLPCRFSELRKQAALKHSDTVAKEAERLLTRLGLDIAKLRKRPLSSLSIGQQQRVAAARSLIGSPSLIIADEPTSALDPTNRDRFIELLLEESVHSGSTLILVSHDPELGTGFQHHLSLEVRP